MNLDTKFWSQFLDPCPCGGPTGTPQVPAVATPLELFMAPCLTHKASKRNGAGTALNAKASSTPTR